MVQLDHGALHAQVGDVAERGRVERDLVGLGHGEEGADQGGSMGSASMRGAGRR
jgi:hypothetical protein